MPKKMGSKRKGVRTAGGLVSQKQGVGKAIRPPKNPRPNTGKRTY